MKRRRIESQPFAAAPPASDACVGHDAGAEAPPAEDLLEPKRAVAIWRGASAWPGEALAKASRHLWRLQPVPAGAGLESSFFGTPAEAREFLRLARRSDAIQHAGSGIARRLLLTGPAGSGKKTLACAIAGALDAGFATLSYHDSRDPARLAQALDSLNAQARHAGRAGVAYVEARDCATASLDDAADASTYIAWLRAWASGAHRHLYIIVGAPNARCVNGVLEDAVAMKCVLRRPDATARRALWSHALADARADRVTSLLDSEAVERVVVRPSEGLYGGELLHALRFAIREAVLEAPDAPEVSLTQEHLRAGISHTHKWRNEASNTLMGQLML